MRNVLGTLVFVLFKCKYFCIRNNLIFLCSRLPTVRAVAISPIAFVLVMWMHSRNVVIGAGERK